MPDLSVDQLLSLLAKSKLFDEQQSNSIIAECRRTLAGSEDVRACADYLTDAGIVTAWQCKKLLEGRYKGFFLGKYRLLDHLGSGGMSSVYLAEHRVMRRRVAIKVLPLHRGDDSTYVARLQFEAQAAAALDHPNIVRVYDLDQEGRIHYLVMEYLEGRDLHAVVEVEGPLDFRLAAEYVAQVAAGLEHAHAAGLVHRDIKPSNLLVDSRGTVKILDLGLAKFVAADAAAEPGLEDLVLGTADYLAPEQAVNSQTVDPRADIYSLGCTLYYLLTGHAPFAHGTSSQRLAAHRQQLPPSILLDQPDAPPELVDICRRMMEKSPENRYPSATAAAEALRLWLASVASGGSAQAPSRAAVRPPPPALRRPPRTRIGLVSGSSTELPRQLELPPVVQPPPVSVDLPLASQSLPFEPPARRRRIAGASNARWWMTLLLTGLLMGAVLAGLWLVMLTRGV